MSSNAPRKTDIPEKNSRDTSLAPREEDGSEPNTPPSGSPQLPQLLSPRHEGKVKQIRKRVEDMDWKDRADSQSSQATQMDDAAIPSQQDGEPFILIETEDIPQDPTSRTKQDSSDEDSSDATLSLLSFFIVS
jgi:hypothetical protein